jgi:hypothetical protein
MILEYWPVVVLGLGGILGANLAYQLAFKPWWYQPDRQKEMIARRAGYALAHHVLHWVFGYSHTKHTENGKKLQLVRFLTPMGRRVSLAGDATGNDHPHSFIKVWDWSTWSLQELPVGSIYLEIDLFHLPYDHSIDWLVTHKEDIEIQAMAQLLDSGVKRVKMQHTWLKDRNQQRVIFRVVFREREKSPDIPQRVDYQEMVTAWVDFEANRRKYNRVEILQQERFKARLLDYGIKEFDGTFPLKKLQAAFAGDVSHRQIEAIGQELEEDGVLVSMGGPSPRRINVERARALIEGN